MYFGIITIFIFAAFQQSYSIVVSTNVWDPFFYRQRNAFRYLTHQNQLTTTLTTSKLELSLFAITSLQFAIILLGLICYLLQLFTRFLKKFHVASNKKTGQHKCFFNTLLWIQSLKVRQTLQLFGELLLLIFQVQRTV